MQTPIWTEAEHGEWLCAELPDYQILLIDFKLEPTYDVYHRHKNLGCFKTLEEAIAFAAKAG